jgi:hypothetical protein
MYAMLFNILFTNILVVYLENNIDINFPKMGNLFQFRT